MHQVSRWMILGFACLGLAGCVFVHTEGRPHSRPEAVVVPASSADSVLAAEIDAASKLDFDHSRLQALKSIAQRPQLSPEAQVRLVNAAYKHLDFEHSKVDLLETVIKNPGFCNAAKETTLKHLKNLAFDHNRQAILDTLNRRGTLEQ